MNGLKPKRSKPRLRSTWLTPCIEVLTNLMRVDSLRALERVKLQRFVMETHRFLLTCVE
jgi:hypothetical protein